jgi:hypothetical protein
LDQNLAFNHRDSHMNNRQLCTLSFVFCISALAACAQVPMASSPLDQEAKQFKTVADKAVIYVVRDEVFGGAIPVTVVVDGRVAGSTTAQSYVRVVVEPGQRIISTLSPSNRVATIQALSAATYFIRLEMKFSVSQPGLNELVVMDQVSGRNAVMKSRLVERAM